MPPPLSRRTLPDPTDMHVGARVRAKRMLMNMSQEKLGDALGLTFQQIQKYEKGTNRMGSSRLQQISVILKEPVEYFFEGLPGRVNSSENAHPAYTDVLRDFLSLADGVGVRTAKAMLRITPEARRCVLRLLQEMARGRPLPSGEEEELDEPEGK
jgi:transcriptional regulator with XRE-family HTH domain